MRRPWGTHPPKYGYIPYFLSFFWEAQDVSWPIYYPRSREALTRAGVFRESGSLSERYVAFRDTILDLSRRLETTAWGVELLLFSLSSGDRSRFEALVANELNRAGLNVERHPSFGGVQPDFVATDAVGPLIVVEARIQSPTQRGRNRFAETSRLYREVLGADAAVTVVQGLDASESSFNLLRLDDLAEWIALHLPTSKPRKESRPRTRPVE